MIHLANELIEVAFDVERPFPISYRHRPSQRAFSGVPSDFLLTVNDHQMPWSEWMTVVDPAGLPHRLGYDLRHDQLGYLLRFEYEVKGFELVFRLTVVSDPLGTLRSVGLPHQMLLVKEASGYVWREEWTQRSWDEKLGRGLWSPNLVHQPIDGFAGDDEPLPAVYACYYDASSVCIGVKSSCLYIPLRNQVHWDGTGRAYSIGLAPYTFRARKKVLAPLVVAIAFLPDLNGDGRTDECDYQLWVNRQLPQPPPTYREAIWYKIYCGDPGRGVATSFDQAEEIIERVNRFTGGLPQIVHLVGWQYDGHDTGYPSLDAFNEKLGTPDRLRALHRRCKEELNTTLTYHINLDDSYPTHPGWDPDVICREPNGDLMRWEEFNGEMSYHICHTKDVESGKVFKKLESLMNTVPLEGAIHLDAFRNMNWSWEPDGLIGPVEELECGVKPIVQWFRERGIDVTTEGCDHSAAEWAGIVSGVLHVGRPRDLVQLRHGKMIYGGRFWPPSVWGYGLGTSINWDVVYGDCAKEWYGCEWWPLLLDGIYLGTLLYHYYLEREMLSAKLDDDGARLLFADGTETYVKRDNSGLRVWRGDLVLADGFDRFIPRGNTIYAFSRDGSQKDWVLPDRFRNQVLTVEELGEEPPARERLRAGDSIRLLLKPRTPVRIRLEQQAIAIEGAIRTRPA